MYPAYNKKLTGALTSKPFAFTARSWEVVMVPSVDTYDSFLGSLRLDFRNNDLLRVLPLINEDLNEEWLTDKARFSYDGLKRQRFLKPYMRSFGPYHDGDEGAENYFKVLLGLGFNRKLLHPTSKSEFLSSFTSALTTVNRNYASVYFGKEVDLETALSVKLNLEAKFKEVVYLNGDYSNHTRLNPDLLRFSIDPNLFLSASELFLVGSNLRWELPLFNIKVMRRVTSGATSVFAAAVRSVFSFPVINLSSNAQSFLCRLASGRLRLSLKVCNPFVILSYNLASYASLLSLLKGSTIGIVFPWASTATLLEVCPSKLSSDAKTDSVVLAINSDVISLSRRSLSLGLLSNGHSNHSKLDFIFPSSAYSEANSHFFNIFRSERYARFGYALSKDVAPSWASLASLFRPKFSLLISFAVSLQRTRLSLVASKPFENEFLDQISQHYLNKLPTLPVPKLVGGLFYEVTPSYYRTHYSSRSSKPASLAAARFSLLNFLKR